ncbi:MAG: ADP-ribosylglycohydrolase family protein [candidate division Zixibacteria bacterium]|nr:ADP-ribosylglycohydrolase family protein [candidate division Zixibacteria bacterium]NIR66705.1 ADP-ribosylglycohydrolase family protein [candidate division Zixibacteria bacterium]NIS14894.1 ADP-ribosylglycohydrolase family protein [candidate division Zixibacteria bacterium]NIS48244.1 ADP-ribosylglycohydrolase family protein [candidate division Zixibacteria bacterium]NIT51413.1 ADP-ribosylglycohydrolase family protein [candidate division Zixibacteria bacterium]
MFEPSKTKFRGCLLGQCLGDALGFPIEGHDENDCSSFIFRQAKYWFDGYEPSPEEWPGQYTDDSQLARELLESMIEKGGFDPEDYAARINVIFSEQRIVGQGLATANAARRLYSGVSWKESGEAPPSAGNGTAMRAAPVGMFYYNNTEEMIKVAHTQGWISHKDPRCSAGSVAIAGATALALTDQAEDTNAFIENIAKWAAYYNDEFSKLILVLKDWILLPPHKALAPISRAGKSPDYIDGWPGISPFVVSSVLWSLYSFLRYKDSYWDAISTAVSVGGDVDTTGAMTGAIAGAYKGEEALPKHLTKLLNDRGTWGYEELTALADKCHEIKKS